jgi:arsenate reductase
MSGQYSKSINDIPKPDIAISMGCGVRCPYIVRAFDDDWGLEDPTGKADEEYITVITEIRKHLKQLMLSGW